MTEAGRELNSAADRADGPWSPGIPVFHWYARYDATMMRTRAIPVTPAGNPWRING